MGFVKAEEFVNQYMRVNREIREMTSRKNEEFKFNIFIFYCNTIDSLCTEHILQFHKNLKREVNIFSYGVEKKEDIFNFFKKYDDIYAKNKDYYRDYFFQVILVGICSHLNTDVTIYEKIEEFFSKVLDPAYLAYLKFFVIDNKRPFHEIFEDSEKWNLILSEKEYGDVMSVFEKYKGKEQSYKKFSEYYSIIKEENKCMTLLIYPFIQCVSEDDASSVIFITSISLISYLKTDQITHEYYNKEIKNLHSDSLNISSGHFLCFEAERGLLPLLSFLSLNESLEIDERIYIFDHKNMKNTFNQIRTMCHIEIKEFTGNFRQLEMKKQNEILRKIKSYIKIIKPMNALGWKRRTYVLYNNDSFYFLIILIYIHINRTKKINGYLYNCLKTSDFLYNIYKDRLKQSEIYDKLIEKHLYKTAANYLSVLIKKVMDANKKTINITSTFKIYLDIVQNIRNTYSHPFELKFVATMFASFQSRGSDKHKHYHLLVSHIIDSDETILFGYAPLAKKNYWPIIFSQIAYSNSEQVTYDTLTDINVIQIKKSDFKFIFEEIKDLFRGIVKAERRKEITGKITDEEELEENFEDNEQEELTDEALGLNVDKKEKYKEEGEEEEDD